MKLEHFLTSYTKINLKYTEDLNISSETTTFLEENVGRTFFDIIGIFLDPPPRVMKIKPKINKWDQFKLKSFCTEKETINK